MRRLTLFALTTVLFGCELRAQPVEFDRLAFVGSHVGMVVKRATSDWVVLEHSMDMQAWKPLALLHSTNSAVLHAHADARWAPAGFYRASVQPDALDAAKERWEGKGISHYRFDATVVELGGATVWQGQVEVANGVKTVRNVRRNDTPVAEYDPELFKDFDELFAIAQTARAGGAHSVEFEFDFEADVPHELVIPRRSVVTTVGMRWEVSGFEEVE